MSAARGTVLLRRFPVEGIDILSSGVAEQQRRIVGRESQRSPVTSDRNEILQVDQFGSAKDAFGKLSPLLHLEVEQYQVARPNAQCENVSSVGRPSGPEKPPLRSRQSGNLVARQVKDPDRRSSVTGATTEDNFVTARRPVRIALRAWNVRHELPGTAALGCNRIDSG